MTIGYGLPIISGLSTDTKPTTNVPIGLLFFETNTRLFFYWDGILWRVNTSIAAAMGKKYTIWHGYNPWAEGFLGNNANLTTVPGGSIGRSSVEADGLATTFVSGAVSGNDFGFYSVSSVVNCYRSWNPRIFSRQKISANALTTAYHGWISSNAIPTGDTPLNNLSGFLIGKRTADTNWFIIKNDGDATQDVVDTGVAVGTGIFQIELSCDNANSRIGWSIVADGGTPTMTFETVEIPAATTGLYYFNGGETQEGVAKTLSVYYWQAIQDK